VRIPTIADRVSDRGRNPLTLQLIRVRFLLGIGDTVNERHLRTEPANSVANLAFRGSTAAAYRAAMRRRGRAATSQEKSPPKRGKDCHKGVNQRLLKIDS
jgi:hypothetical protein